MKATEELKQLRLLNKNSEIKAVTYEVGGYNSRRYGNPWIAQIQNWEIGERPSLKFGYSSAHSAEIAGKTGDIIKYGQKDNRKPLQSDNDFGIIDENYKIIRITEAQAKELYRAI